MDLRYTNIIPLTAVDNGDEDYNNSNGIDIHYDRKKNILSATCFIMRMIVLDLIYGSKSIK